MPPSDVDWGWSDAPAPLFDTPLPEAVELTVSRAFADLSRLLCSERSGRGFALANALLHRLQTNRGLLGQRADPDVAAAERIAKDIRRDLHKMHAFVRFRETGDQSDRRRFVAWFEPTHRIEEAVADFFVNRFGDMDWTIVTPEVTTAYVDGKLSQQAVAASRPDDGDPLEALWTTYYSNIFNPARLKVDAMTAEMPKKYWRNLPEARVIPDLIAGARAQVTAMQTATPTPARPVAPVGPPNGVELPTTLAEVRLAAASCNACPLYGQATHTVFGEGPDQADLMIVGEQPGDHEDLAGRPFVGPAGRLFDTLAAQAGLDRSAAYVTNAVKHFRFAPRGKRRIHQRPDNTHITACARWLMHEVAFVDPKLILAMGATAAQALTGTGRDIARRRGTIERTSEGRPVLITLHPSALLRAATPLERSQKQEAFLQDLSQAVKVIK